MCHRRFVDGLRTAGGGAATPALRPQWKLSGDSTRVATIDGRQVLSIGTGAAERRDVKLEDGTIDVDVMTSHRRSFVYIGFRV